MIGLLVFFGAGFLLVVSLRGIARRPRPSGSRAYRGARRSTGVGRSELRTVRRVNDARALARGPGAYGRRVARRAAFRRVARW